ncbi:MAG: 3'-5' exonuclease, partial [Flavobacteriales bacterium]|nr:3'-5' exonuclease [Flavobacteriales bacterium]
FLMPVQKAEAQWTAEKVKDSRPVYYDLDLFSHEAQSTDLDDCLLSELNYVVFDTETTGLDPTAGDEIISIAGVRIVNGKLHSEDTFDQLVNPKRNIPLVSLKIHEIYPEMLADKPTIDKILPRFYMYAENAVLVAHNASFDMRFLQLKEELTGVRFTNPVLDTLLLSAVCHPKQELHNIEDITERLGIELVGRHTALGDSIVTAEILLKLIPILEAKGIKTLRQAREESMKTPFAKIQF